MVRSATRTWAQTFAAALPYAVAFGAAVWAGFGAPAFIALSVLAMFRLGTSQRWQNDTSAYSVFNAGGTRIAGTLTAEQIDGQLRHAGHSQKADGAGESAASGPSWAGGRKLGGGGASPPSAAQQRAAAADAAQARAARAAQQGAGPE